MQKFKVRMEWGGKDNTKWMMNHLRLNQKRQRIFLMDFPNCRNVNRYFEGLDPSKSNKYRITLDPIGKEPLDESVS